MSTMMGLIDAQRCGYSLSESTGSESCCAPQSDGLGGILPPAQSEIWKQHFQSCRIYDFRQATKYRRRPILTLTHPTSITLGNLISYKEKTES
jgi:hypothetical protein